MHTDFTEKNGIASLATGIFGDAQQLVQQQIALAKAELRVEVGKLKIATRALVIGLAIAFLGCIPIPFLLADIILHFTQGELSAWETHGMVCVLFITVGSFILASAMRKFKEVAGAPERKIESLKEEFNGGQ